MYVSLTVVCLYLCVSVGVCLPACSSICRLVSRSTGQSELSCAGRSVGHSVRGGGGGSNDYFWGLGGLRQWFYL